MTTTTQNMIFHKLPQHESDAMEHLVQAWNAMCLAAHGDMYKDDLKEFQFHIHALQNCLMARGFRLMHPQQYRIP